MKYSQNFVCVFSVNIERTTRQVTTHIQLSVYSMYSYIDIVSMIELGKMR